MSDLVGNPEDRFSQNEAHIMIICLFNAAIFIAVKIGNFQMKNCGIFGKTYIGHRDGSKEYPQCMF